MKYIMFALLALVVVPWVLAACTGFKSQKPSDYAGTTPTFDIKTQLGGPLVSQGIIYGPTGKISVRYVADMNGTWDGDKGVLAENFVYDSGVEQVREWQITLGENGAFTATAADVIGTAEGQVSGSTLRMTYKIQLTEGAGGYVLDVVDWIYLIEDGTMINKSVMSKFGIKVAELVGTIRPK